MDNLVGLMEAFGWSIAILNAHTLDQIVALAESLTRRAEKLDRERAGAADRTGVPSGPGAWVGPDNSLYRAIMERAQRRKASGAPQQRRPAA